MTTEVQISKCSSHLSHLRTVVSFAAARLGMSRKEIEETQSAVNEICQRSIDLAADHQDANLSVKLAVFDDYMTVEITDPCVHVSSLMTTEFYGCHSNILETVGQLADRVDITRNEDGSTVKIMKYASRVNSTPVGVTNYVPAYGVSMHS